MNDSPPATDAGRDRRVRAVVLEGLLVAVVGAVMAFAANAISPRGLALARDYFPRATQSAPPPKPTVSATHTSAETNAPAPVSNDPTVERLRAKGLRVVTGDEAAALFHDPRHEQDSIIFVDARDDEHYQAGHIPGAFQFDHYHPDKYLSVIVPACQSAQKIIVYCNGGECEDSEFTAVTLVQIGIPSEKVFVFAGGIKEWEAKKLPVETGGRKSGNIRNAEK